jgi:hypothetical protein
MLLAAGGSLTIGVPLNVLSLDLVAGGNIDQTGGVITATTLGANAGGFIHLGGANLISNLASVTAGLDFILNDATSLVVQGTGYSVALSVPTATAHGPLSAATPSGLLPTVGAQPVTLTGGTVEAKGGDLVIAVSGAKDTLTINANALVKSDIGNVVLETYKSAGDKTGATNILINGTVQAGATASPTQSTGNLINSGGNITIGTTGIVTAANAGNGLDAVGNVDIQGTLSAANGSNWIGYWTSFYGAPSGYAGTTYGAGSPVHGVGGDITIESAATVTAGQYIGLRTDTFTAGTPP